MKEIRSHTALRGIASVGVVLYHYSLGLEWHHFIEKSHALVDLFFMLSGFIMAAVYSDALDSGGNLNKKEFFFNRFARIYPLYISSILFLLFFMLGVGKDVNSEALMQFVYSVFGIQSWGFADQYYLNYPSWSISAEFAAYLLFPLLAAYWRSGLSTLYLLTAVVISYLVLTGVTETLNFDERLAGIRGPMGFILGMLIYQHRNIIDKVKNVSMLQFVSVAAFVIVFFLPIFEIFLIPVFAILILGTWKDSGIIGKALTNEYLNKLGVWSFGIYLLHIPVQIVFYYIRPHFFVLNNMEKDYQIILMVIFTVVISAFSFHYFEDPARKAIKKIGKRRSAQPSLTGQ